MEAIPPIDRVDKFDDGSSMAFVVVVVSVTVCVCVCVCCVSPVFDDGALFPPGVCCEFGMITVLGAAVGLTVGDDDADSCIGGSVGLIISPYWTGPC